MNIDELLAMPEADAIAALTDEANWPTGITGAVQAEWHKIAPADRLQWLHNTEEICRTLDPDAFRQWQERACLCPACALAGKSGRQGTDRRRGDSIPAYYRGYWKTRRRMRNGI